MDETRVPAERRHSLPVRRSTNPRFRTESEGTYDDDPGAERAPLSPVSEGMISPEEYFLEPPVLPPPPDGGWGWVIVFASFMCNLIVDGIAYTFGVFMVEFVEYFGEGKGKTAWVGSLLSGVYLSVGPIVSALTNKYGCRTVCIIGSVIACLGFSLSVLSPNINILMLTYGVLGGLGFGFIYLPAVVCVGYYFEKKRALATGIAVCGSGVGTFVFAPFASFLLDMFDWKNANLILAGIILNCAVFGAMMRPLKMPKNLSCTPLLQRMAEEKRFQLERGSISGSSYFMVQLPDGTMERRLKIPVNIDPGVHSSFNLDQLVPGSPLTPVPTMVTLPTISEARPTESADLNTTPTKEEVEEHVEETNGDVVANGDDSKRKRQDSESANSDSSTNRSPTKPVRNFRPGMPRNGSTPQFTIGGTSIPKNVSVPLFDRMQLPKRGSYASMTNNAKGIGKSRDLRKHSLQLRLSNSSFARASDVSYEDVYSKLDESELLSYMLNRREIIRPLSRKDIFYSGSIVNLPEYQSQKSLHSYRQSILNIPHPVDVMDVDGVEKPDTCTCPCACTGAFRSAFKQMIDCTLMSNVLFLLIGISNVFGMLGFYVPFVYIMDVAMEQGIEQDKAAFLLSIIGITNTFGRVLAGYISDFPQVNSLLLNNLCIALSGVCVLLIPFCSNYAMFCTIAVFFGLFVSGYISLTSIILVDLLGLDNLTNAFGLLILFRGGASIIGPPLAGAVYDATESYDISFYLAGCFLLIAAVISFLVPVLRDRLANRKVKLVTSYSNGKPIVVTAVLNEDVDQESSL